MFDKSTIDRVTTSPGGLEKEEAMKLNAIASRSFWLMLGWLVVTMPANGFYDPSLGRWLNRDPIEEKGGINLYEFNFNNALDRIDTDGRGSLANPGSAAIAAEAEAAALNYPSYAVMQAALREAARKAALAGAAGLALAQSQCKPKNDDPCKRFDNLRNYIRQNHNDALTKVSNVIKANGTQADLNKIPGLTPELQAMMAAMYQAAAECRPGPKNSFNEERAKFLRGETNTGPGSNTIR